MTTPHPPIAGPQNYAEEVAVAGQPGPQSRRLALEIHRFRARNGRKPTLVSLGPEIHYDLLKEQCLPLDSSAPIWGLAVRFGPAGWMLVTA